MILHVGLETEAGDVLERCEDTIGAAKTVFNAADDSTAMLPFIDPYGETVFNLLQCGVLQDEWERVLANCPDALQPWALKVHGLIQKCAREPHVYLRFSGD